MTRIPPILVILCILSAALPAAAQADREIHYQNVAAVHGERVLVRDQSPEGETYYTCEVSNGDCREVEGAYDFFLPLYGSTDYPTSPQGRFGISRHTLPVNGTPTTFLSFFDISAGDPEPAGLLTVSRSIVAEQFSPDEMTYVVVTAGGTVVVYDLAAQARRTITIPQTELPFFAVSYHGTYISAYNYVHDVHRMWDTRTGQQYEVPGVPSYVEFNESEDEAAFLVDRAGFKNLAVVHNLTNTPTVERIVSGDFLVEDYLYVNDQLFYLANKEAPLAWNLYAYGERAPLAHNASYGDYLTRVDGQLGYLTVEAQNANVYLYDPATETHTRLQAAPQSSRISGVEREAITIAGRSAALLSPTDETPENLFIWLHGGPQRQTSVGFHPYFSYAVYDELLERIAAAGNYVIKLDYAGSWGYGEAFSGLLDQRVGTVEINDVIETIETFTNRHDVENVYLIGNSYGGYMALRTINEVPEQVDGVVSINGVTDWHGLIATIPSSPFRTLFNGVPDLHNLALYRSASVFTNFETLGDQPLLLFYGTEDSTVPTTQSRQYEEFMRAYNKEVTLVPLTGETHILRNRETLATVCDTIADTLNLSNVSCN